MELTTVGEVAGLRLTADRSQLTADGQDLAFITVESIDAQGRFQPNGNQSVSFKVEGAGTLAGVASGDYSTTESYQANQRQAFQRKGQLIVRTGKNAGPISISADAKDVKSATMVLATVAKPSNLKSLGSKVHGCRQFVKQLAADQGNQQGSRLPAKRLQERPAPLRNRSPLPIHRHPSERDRLPIQTRIRQADERHGDVY